jgi:hypothetical protein
MERAVHTLSGFATLHANKERIELGLEFIKRVRARFDQRLKLIILVLHFGD